MAQLNQPFDPSSVPPRESFAPIPDGWYAAHIVDSEMRATKDNRGEYLLLKLEILESEHPDIGKRVLFDRLNMVNPNQKAVDIAQRTLSSICDALGHTERLEDTEDLHLRPLAIRVTTKPATDAYEAQNEIKGYDDIGARFGGEPAPAKSAPAPKASPATPQTAPWRRKA